MNNYLAMIPAAGRGSRMFSLTDENPKVMLPIRNKPLIAWHLDKLIEDDITKVCIIVGYKKEKVINYVNRFYKSRFEEITFAEQKHLTGLASAVLEGINAVEIKRGVPVNDYLFIILGDTIVEDEHLPSKSCQGRESFVAYNKVEDYKRWCMVRTINETVSEFIDKPQEKPQTDKALIGVYGIRHPQSFKKCLKEVIGNDIRIRGEYQISSALDRYRQYAPIHARKFNSWFDCGEIETFKQTRHNICRHFNSIEFTKYRTVIKASQNCEKMVDEVNWYKELPARLKVFTPQLIDSNTQHIRYSYEMEYCDYEPLHNLFMYIEPESHDWVNIFKEINFWLESARQNVTTKITPTETVTDGIKIQFIEMMLKKTIKRLQQLDKEGPEVLRKLLEQKTIKVNGKVMPNYCSQVELMMQMVSGNLCTSEAKPTILHGDLFFGNILYDIHSRSMKLVDPRGSFGTMRGCVGDERYDIAKLNHSVHGRYDFIVNGLYLLTKRMDANFDNIELDYEIYDCDKHYTIEDEFDRLILKNYDRDLIDTITGFLFLSMIPLHKDSLDNQIMFFIKANEFFHKVVKAGQ